MEKPGEPHVLDTNDPSLANALLNNAYMGNLTSFKEVAVSLDRGRGCLSKTVAEVTNISCGSRIIHIAAAGGNLPVLKYLLEDLQIELNTLDKLGRTPLSYSSYNGRSNTVLYLLKCGALPNCPDYNGLTPLHYSVEAGHIDAANILLSNNLVDVNQLSAKGTALHIAANVGNSNAVKLLLCNGANVKAGVNNMTPLALAVLAPSPICVRLLIEAGADVEDISSLSLAMMSVNNGLGDCIRRLLDMGAETNVLYDEDLVDAPMIPFPLCSHLDCNRIARFALGCCGQTYCTAQHVLTSHTRNHVIGVPKMFNHSDIQLDAAVPGCVYPACPPWWLHKVFHMDNEIIYMYRSSDPEVGDQMFHSYTAGNNEPVVEF